MSAFANPAVAAFVAQLGNNFTFAQVQISRTENGYELRHVSDRPCPVESLRVVPPDQVRTLAQFTAAGTFRPLKSAPDLSRGWRVVVQNESGLETALAALYPGSIADWFTAQATPPPVTHYREFTDRQTGMYRVTQRLSDSQVAHVIAACCDKSRCLKRRLWTVEGLTQDSAQEKSLIPCLEPCALLLEFARKASRVEKPGQ
jgi:hypothetical protein